MAEYAEFQPAIIAHVGNDCPGLVVMSHLKTVVRDFLDLSQTWVYDCPEIEVVDRTQRMYVLDLPADSMVCKMWSIHGRKCVGEYFQEPHYYINFNNQLVFESDLPTYFKKIEVVASLKTMQDALTCPDFVYQNYHDIIVAGTVARIQLMPATTWFNPQSAEINQAIYKQGVDRAKNDVQDGFGLKRQPKRTRPFYN